MYTDRIKLYQELEKKLNSKVLVYVTSDRAGFEASIAQDVIDLFINQLDSIGVREKISLYLCIQEAGILRQRGILLICYDSIVMN